MSVEEERADNVRVLPCPYQLADVSGWHPCILPRNHPGPCSDRGPRKAGS